MVVIQAQEHMEIFVNRNETITIKQIYSHTLEETIIIVRPENVSAVVKALYAARKELDTE